MKAIITGMNGTLAPYIYDLFSERGYDMTIWHRSEVAIDDAEAIHQFIEKVSPDIFLHVATGPKEWLALIIQALKPHHIPLVFMSSEAVYDESQTGPFDPSVIPFARSDYGKYKIACEDIINHEYADHTYIIRLGWQIATHTHKNNLLAYLVTEEHVKASKNWILSTSFMPDTASAVFQLISDFPPDIYHLDSNKGNWNFYELVKRLKDAFLLPITLEAIDDKPRNNRLIGEHNIIQSLEETLKAIVDSHQNSH